MPPATVCLVGAGGCWPDVANPGHPCYHADMPSDFPPLHTLHEARIEELGAQVASLADRIGRLEAENARMASALSDTREQVAVMRAHVAEES